MKQKNEKIMIFLILLGITLIDYFLPDPIPIIDEVILTGLTLWRYSKIDN